MNDVQTVQSKELIIAQQENQILKLKYELQELQAKKTSRLEDSLFAPTLFNHYQKVAETLSKSNMIPTAYRGKPEDIFVAMAMGYQLGFPVEQSLQDIAVINGRPCLWGDGLISLVLNHPDCEGINELPIYSGQVVTGYICTVKRKGHEPHTKSFTIQDAERAGLLKKGGVWQYYPDRMLQMRARSLALRDRFADALRGLRQAEVEQDDHEVYEGEIVQSNNQVEKLKKLLSVQSTTDNKAETETKSETIDPDAPATSEQIAQIAGIMKNRDFDEARRQKAFDYFKIDKLTQLTAKQADVFLVQLSKS